MNESQILMSKLLGPRDPAELNCVGFSARDIDEILKYAPPSLAHYSQFLTFLSVMGLEDGGLLDSEKILHFHSEVSFLNLVSEYENFYEKLREAGYFPSAGVYLLEIYADEIYYFDFDKENQHVYVYNDRNKKIKDTGWDFFTYLDNRCAIDKSQFHRNKRCTRYREVLPEQLPAVKPAPSEKEGSDFVSLMDHKNTFPHLANLKGYNMQEIALLEAVYNIGVTGELLLFLFTMGRNHGGILSSLSAMHNNMLSYLDVTNELRELLEEYGRSDLAEEVFILEMDDEDFCLLFYAKSDGGVYYIDNDSERLFMAYNSISDLLTKRSEKIERNGVINEVIAENCTLLFDFEVGPLY
ncbi:hypothetical protein [Pseudoalteromonas obscura]|uniref:SMI1/KNR4 family protein n=1 Tax=Pseudoalteromonas obscura TaxID=3048491 RepID=A0ABT7EG14_9GAMM|nr:hypothetical protein [Pseudoalteromonas sp. P94(2023)]MDK2593794.1 hypothetical protein [Pseudoalteromonas sp. P94(2023)]